MNKLDPMANYYMFSVSGTPTIKGKTADILVSKEKQVYGQINGVAYAGEPLTIAGNNEDFKENTVIVVVKDPVKPADVIDKFEYQSEEFELAEGKEALGANLPEDPSKEGYIFKGWNTKKDGTGEAVTAKTKADKNMVVYAIFEKNTAEVVPPFMSSVTVENGKVTIVLKDKPTKAPTIEDVKLQMNLNGAGNKDVKITGFKYDGDKTIILTFEKIASTDKKQTFTMTVTLGDQSVTTREITVPAKTTSEDEKAEDNKNNVKTGDNTPITTLVVTMLLAAGIVVATLFYRRKKVK